MKTIQDLIIEVTSKDADTAPNPLFPKFPYIRGKGRITQITYNEKLHKEIVNIVGGDYFIDKDSKYYRKIVLSSKDNGKTFVDTSVFNPTKETKAIKSLGNVTYKSRIDTSKKIFSIDHYNTKTGDYKGTIYYVWKEELE